MHAFFHPLIHTMRVFPSILSCFSYVCVFCMICLQGHSCSSGTFDRRYPHQLLLQRKDLFSKVIIMLTLFNHKTCEGKCKQINFRMICRKTFKDVPQNKNKNCLV